MGRGRGDALERHHPAAGEAVTRFMAETGAPFVSEHPALVLGTITALLVGAVLAGWWGR